MRRKPGCPRPLWPLLPLQSSHHPGRVRPRTLTAAGVASAAGAAGAACRTSRWRRTLTPRCAPINATIATTKVGPASSSAKSASIEDKIASTSVGKTKPTGYGNAKTTTAAINHEAKITADKEVGTGVGRFVLTTGAASPKATADGSNDESPPTKTKTATASAALTPEEIEELMAKVTAAAHHAATAALYEYTTGEQYRLFRAILGWESLARFTMSQLGRVVSAILYPALGYETTGTVRDQCFALNAWEQLLQQGVSRLGHAVSSNSGWHSITVWINILETLLLHADVHAESAAAEFATAADTVLGTPTCAPF